MEYKISSGILKEKHVKAALKFSNGRDAVLDSWTTEHFIENADNYASTVLKVKLKFHQKGHHGEVSYVAKLSPNNKDDLSKDITHAEFTKDSGFYQKILPSLTSVLNECELEDLRVPRCLFTSLEKGKELMILEDLRRRKFEMHDQKRSLDVPHTNLVLEEVAKLHASSYLLQNRTPHDDLRDKYPELLREERKFRIFTDELISDGFENAYRVLRDFGGHDKAVNWMKSNRTNCTDILLNHYTDTFKFDIVCQGDCWNNNFLFRYDENSYPIEVMLLDFQKCRMASLATELNELMYTSLDGVTRKTYLDSFLVTYYKAFRRVIEASGTTMPSSLEELHREYKKRMEVGLMLGLVFVPWVVSGDEGLQFYEGPPDNEEMMEKFKEDLKVKTVEMLESDPMLRHRFLSIFDDMIEAGVM